MALGGDTEPPWAASPASRLCALLRAMQPVPGQLVLTRPAPAAFLERASPAGTATEHRALCAWQTRAQPPQSDRAPWLCLGVRGALGSSVHVMVATGRGAFLPVPLLQSIAGALEDAELSAGPTCGWSCEVLS